MENSFFKVLSTCPYITFTHCSVQCTVNSVQVYRVITYQAARLYSKVQYTVYSVQVSLVFTYQGARHNGAHI